MRRLLIVGLLFLLLPLTNQAAYGDLVYYFNPTNTFSGTAPAGSLSATFSDVTGGVQLVLTSALAAGENLDPGKALYLNFDPMKASSLGSLTFTLTGNTGFAEAAVVSTGSNAFKADGDGNYDILFNYNPSTKALQNLTSQTYLIAGVSGISTGDFNFGSVGGALGSWNAAVHVQNTPSGGSGSGWVGGSPVPIPGAVWLLGSGLIGLVGIRRKFKA